MRPGKERPAGVVIPAAPVVAISLVERAVPVDTSTTFLRLVAYRPGRLRMWVVRTAQWRRPAAVRSVPPAGGRGRMPADSDSFPDLLRAVMAGDRDATERFCREYQGPILRMVRQRLLRRLRSKYDSLDFVHDVWASFFQSPPRHLNFDGPAEVIRFLEQLARRKVYRAIRQRLQTHKNDINREQPLPEPAPGSFSIPLPASDPTPSQLVSAEERWQGLVRQVRDEPGRLRILTLLRNGMTHREIADRLNTNEKTVQRLVRRLDPRPRA